MLAAKASPPVREALLQEKKEPEAEEHTPNSIEELAVMLENAAKMMPPDETKTDFREEITRRLATGGFRPGSAPPSSAPALAAPVPRHTRQRRERVRLGSECPTELESAFENALKSAWRWLMHAPQPMPTETSRRANRRRSAEDSSSLPSPPAVEKVLKRCPTWPRIG